MSDREPIDAEFVEVRNAREDEPWPVGWPASLRGLPRCATCENFAYGGAREMIPVAVAGVRHHPSCPTIRGAACARPPAGWRCSRPAGHDGPCAARRDASVATTAGDRARGVSALLAAGAGVLAEGSRAAGEIATGADEVERGLNRAKDAGERFGGAVAKVGDALKRMGVIGAGGRAPMTRERPARRATGKAER